MKISKYVKLSQSIKLKKLCLLRMKQHYYGKNLYIVCTSYHQGRLFEIMPSERVTHRYDACYLLGVATTKEEAIEYVQTLVHALYGAKTLTLADIKCSKRGEK